MVKRSETIRVLVLHESPDEAEQIINALRNSGKATRATQVVSEEELVEQLKQHHWDLFLARPESDGLAAELAFEHIKRLEKDIPTIVLIDQNDSDEITDCLRMGAKDAVPIDEIERLLLVINRELDNLTERRQRRQADVALREAERRCNLLLDNSRDAITYVTDGMHIYANESYLEMFGYEEADELEGMPILDMVSPKDHEKFKTFLKHYNAGKSEADEINCIGLTSDGSEVAMRMDFSAASYDGEPCIQIVIQNDSGDAELQEKLKEISSQDLLTGLYNRQYFLQQLNSAIESALAEKEDSILLYIEVDNFNEVKLQHSIAGADMVLGDLSAVLRELVGEPHLLSRFADKEFTVLMPNTDSEAALALAEKIRGAIEEHMSEVHGRTVQVTVSIGAAIINESCPGSEEIISRAHQALMEMRSETGVGNGVRLFIPQITQTEDEISIGEKLQQAIDEGMFKILFQPIISLRGDEQEFYEVLLRMLDDDGSEISPVEFLGSAASNKLSEKIDRWVIIQSIKALAAQRSAGHDTRLIINLTAESLQDKTLLSWLSVALKAARVPGDALIFQITESDATSYLKQAISFTKGLAELHCQFSISRFGCALNPYNTLKHLKVDLLKIDGSFTQEIDNEDSRERLGELVQTAHSEGKLVVAPFVESAGVLSTLWQLSINFIQGYYLAPPMEEMNYDFSSEE